MTPEQERLAEERLKLLMEWTAMAEEQKRLEELVQEERRHEYGSLVERIESFGRQLESFEHRLFGNGQKGKIADIDDALAHHSMAIALIEQREASRRGGWVAIATACSLVLSAVAAVAAVWTVAK